MSRPLKTSDAEADAICEGVVKLLQKLQAWQTYSREPIRRDPYHDAVMRVIYGDGKGRVTT